MGVENKQRFKQVGKAMTVYPVYKNGKLCNKWWPATDSQDLPGTLVQHLSIIRLNSPEGKWREGGRGGTISEQ